MKRHINSWMVLLLVLTFITGTARAAGEHDVMKVVRQIDELYRSSSSFAEVEMEIVTPHWQRTLSMKVWSRGMDQTFIRILSSFRGKGIVRTQGRLITLLDPTRLAHIAGASARLNGWAALKTPRNGSAAQR